jgi:hypothetical protein
MWNSLTFPILESKGQSIKGSNGQIVKGSKRQRVKASNGTEGGKC